MGFKLLFGVATAANQLLEGSGVSLSGVENGQPHYPQGLALNLDLNNRVLAAQNSNLGFKLNITSVG